MARCRTALDDLSQCLGAGPRIEHKNSQPRFPSSVRGEPRWTGGGSALARHWLAYAMTCRETTHRAVGRGRLPVRGTSCPGIEHAPARWQRSAAESLLLHVSTRRPDPVVPGATQPMSKTPSHRSTASRPRTSHPLPTTIWFPSPDEPNAAPIPGAVLPAWAIDKVRTDFVGRPGDRPLPLLKIAIRDTAPGMDARIPSTPISAEADDEDTPGRPSILLAELHPDTLPAPSTDLPVAGSEMPGAQEDGWPGFFHRAHRLLPPNGILLLATRQRRDAGRLTDPLGALIAGARTAGFRYLQHIVVVYGHPVGDRLVPAFPSDASRCVAHCDLIALSAIRHT
jgi:hypothetical protein